MNKFASWEKTLWQVRALGTFFVNGLLPFLLLAKICRLTALGRRCWCRRCCLGGFLSCAGHEIGKVDGEQGNITFEVFVDEFDGLVFYKKDGESTRAYFAIKYVILFVGLKDFS